VATAAAYYYYPSKEALVTDFYARANVEMQPAIEIALRGAKGLEKKLRDRRESVPHRCTPWMVPFSLVVPQREQRIHAGRAPGGNQRGQKGRQDHGERHDQIGRRVLCGDAEDEAVQPAASR